MSPLLLIFIVLLLASILSFGAIRLWGFPQKFCGFPCLLVSGIQDGFNWLLSKVRSNLLTGLNSYSIILTNEVNYLNPKFLSHLVHILLFFPAVNS